MNTKKSTPQKTAKKNLTEMEFRASPALMEVLGRALTDKEFRQKLASEQELAIEGFKLTKSDLATLKKIKPDALEAQASRLGGRTAITIKVVISKSF